MGGVIIHQMDAERPRAPGSIVMRRSMLKPHLVNGGRIEHAHGVYRLIIPPTPAAAYADAQLDDYDHVQPAVFGNAPPRRWAARARFSHASLAGTAGFGFWNHPFTRDGGVVAPPRNVWFFYGSPESDLRLVRGSPGHGFKAAMLHTPPLPLGMRSGLAGLVSRATGAALDMALRWRPTATVALAAGRAYVRAREAMLDVDMTQWHRYEIDWRADVAILSVDGVERLRATKPPRGPLGFVAWVDNYRASASADGLYRFAYVETTEPQWMELAPET